MDSKRKKSRNPINEYISRYIKIKNKNTILSSSDISNRIKQIRTENPISIAKIN